jgi:hypothetical protein
MADGLDSLSAMRNKTASRRALPPPRHQPRQTPVEMPDPALQSPPAGQTLPPAAPPRQSRPDVSPPPPITGGTDLTKVSIYLDEVTDTYLETVRSAARTAKPRVDATRSAVVRLALNRLAEQLGPAEVIAELQRNAAGHSGPGRKRA